MHSVPFQVYYNQSKPCTMHLRTATGAKLRHMDEVDRPADVCGRFFMCLINRFIIHHLVYIVALHRRPGLVVKGSVPLYLKAACRLYRSLGADRLGTDMGGLGLRRVPDESWFCQASVPDWRTPGTACLLPADPTTRQLQVAPPCHLQGPGRPVTCRDPAALREQKYHDVTVCMVQGGVSFMVKSYQDQDVYRELQQAMASDGCGVVRVIRPEEEG